MQYSGHHMAARADQSPSRQFLSFQKPEVLHPRSSSPLGSVDKTHLSVFDKRHIKLYADSVRQSERLKHALLCGQNNYM